MKTTNKQFPQKRSFRIFVLTTLTFFMLTLIITGASAQNSSVNDFYISKNGENVMIHTILRNKTAPYTIYLEKLNSSGSYVSIRHKTGILSDWDVSYYFTDKLSTIENNIYRIKLVEAGQANAYSVNKAIEILESKTNLADNLQ